MFTLYIANKNYSSWSLRGWLAMMATGQVFEEIKLQLKSETNAPNLGAHSPSGLVPALRHGELVIWDSLAIAEYLAELFPEARLWPEDQAARAIARAASAEMHSGFSGMRQHLSMNIRFQAKGFAVPEAAKADCARIQTLWRELRATYGAKGDYLFGEYSIADVMYAPVVTRFRSYGVPVDAVCQRYMEAIWDRPDMQAWVAEAVEEPPIGSYDAVAKVA